MKQATMTCRPLLISLLLLAAGPGLAGSADPGSQPVREDELTVLLSMPGDPQRGQESYRLCRGCHKADGSGKAEAEYPQLAGQHARVLLKQMADVRAGRRDSPKMNPFIEHGEVSSQELADIAAFLENLPVPSAIGLGDGRQLELGKHLYLRDCASCHGPNGEGDGQRFYPRVAGQHYPYLYRETLESRDRGRRNANPEMVRVLKHYVDSDIAAVSDYMARLRPAKP